MDQSEVKVQALSLVEEANALQIIDDNSYRLAGEFLRERTKPLLAEADRIFDPIIKAAHDSHKAALAAKKEAIDPINRADSIVRRAMSAYSDEQLRRQREEEARIAAEIRRAEQERLREEASRKAAEEAALLAAEAAEDRGDAAEAEKALEEAVAMASPPPAVPVAPAPVPLPAAKVAPVVAGVGVREVWRWRSQTRPPSGRSSCSRMRRPSGRSCGRRRTRRRRWLAASASGPKRQR